MSQPGTPFIRDSPRMGNRIPNTGTGQTPTDETVAASHRRARHGSTLQYCPNMKYPPVRLGKCKACGGVDSYHD